MTTFKGTQRKATATFAVDGVNTDTTVVVTLRAPDGTETNPTATNTATGVYEANLLCTQNGQYTVKFVGTGDVIAVSQTTFHIRDTI